MKPQLLLIAYLTFLHFIFQSHAQPGYLDQSFDPGTGATDWVRTSTIQSDGKIIIGGRFTSYNGTSRNYIARLNSDGSLDTTFNPGTGADLTILTTTQQNDGKILIGGHFNSFNGTPRNRIARLNSDGSLDTSFNPGTGVSGDDVLVAKLQSNGKILIGGRFHSYNGIPRNFIARLNSDGSLDFSFNPGTGANGGVHTIAEQSDGKIIIGGLFTTYNGIPRNGIARLNSDGSLDTSFNPGIGANNDVWKVVLQSDGKILIGGPFTSYNGTPRNRIARLNSDGSLDTSFNPGAGANSNIQFITIQSNGKIIIGGWFTSYNGTQRNRIARLNSDGSLDTSFNPGTGPNNNIRTVSLFNNENIFIGGDFSTYGGVQRNRVAKVYGGCLVSMGTETVTACDNYISPSGKYTWIDSGTYFDTLPGSNGCDSVITVNLTIINSASGIISPTACNSYTSPSSKYTWMNSGTYYDTIPNSNGCDIVITINLTVNSADTSVKVSSDTLTANAQNAAYQWLNCDNNFSEIPDATNQIFIPEATGSYAVRVSQNGCTGTSSCYNVNRTGILKSSSIQISVYPNPFNLQAMLYSYPGFKNAHITIVNVLGQTVRELKEINGETIVLPRENLVPGVYFLQITQENMIVATKKIMITD